MQQLTKQIVNMESALSPKKNSQITRRILKSFIKYKSTEYAYDM